MKIIFLLLFGFYSVCTFADDKFSISFRTTQNSPSPTVILLHGCDGPNIWGEDWATRINSWGYNAVIPDQFIKRGYTNICGRGKTVHPKERVKDLPLIIKWIKEQKWHNGKIAVIGMSLGGTTSVRSAVDESLKNLISATVSFYPECKLLKNIDYSKPLVPSMVHLGEQDDWTPCLNGTWNNYKKHVYSSAGHAFDVNYGYRNYMGHTLWYDHLSSVKSQNLTKEFLNQHLTN